MYKIVGFKKNEGKLDNGMPWSNFTLHCCKTSSDRNFAGDEVQVIKVPTSILQSTFSSSDDLIGSKINIYFDMRTYNGQSKIVVTGMDIIE